MKNVTIIGVPMDLGSGRRGVDMGPSAIRIAGLGAQIRQLGYEVEDAGNIHVHPPEAVPRMDASAHYLPEIAAVVQKLAVRVGEALSKDALPVILGGDHSIAVGSVAGVAAHYRARQQSVGIIWLDAHTDINTPTTTPSGNIHGMPLAALLGHGAPELTDVAGFAPKIRPENAVIIGARSVDPGEKDLIRKLGIRVYTMSEVDARGMAAILPEAIAIATRGTAGFHLTLDMDFIDPLYAPGVGTPERGGATYREAHLGMEMAADSGKILSIEIAEVNPLFDTANQTGKLAAELVLSALGKKIM